SNSRGSHCRSPTAATSSNTAELPWKARAVSSSPIGECKRSTWASAVSGSCRTLLLGSSAHGGWDMATQSKTTYTYADLASFPNDRLRREIIDGELIVTAAPRVRHQQVVVRLVMALGRYADEQGGQVLPAPTDVFFSDTNVVEPDILFVRADQLDKLEEKFVRSAPDLVIEVSSPSTRRLELVRKREL